MGIPEANSGTDLSTETHPSVQPSASAGRSVPCDATGRVLPITVEVQAKGGKQGRETRTQLVCLCFLG